MKKSILLLSALTALLLVSCNNEEKKVREFSANFADKVLDNDVRQLRLMIPGAERCDTFSLENYSPENITVEKQDDGYHVNFSDNRFIIVNKDAKGKFTVVSTYGIVVFDPDLYDFAVRTGWISKYMDDATVASLLSDYEFSDFMIDYKRIFLFRHKTVSNAGIISAKNHLVISLKADN